MEGDGAPTLACLGTKGSRSSEKKQLIPIPRRVQAISGAFFCPRPIFGPVMRDESPNSREIRNSSK